MEQAYFVEIRSRIIPLIDNATNKIQVAMAWFTSSELFNALLRSLNRKVDVELIILDDAINYMYYAPDFNQFIEAGGKLRIADSSVGFMHHKFCIVDDRIAITGSYN
jgi:phosphatidylserine/phosphatidylglycerophosphate/cardiolipin synthase-like enzyme